MGQSIMGTSRTASTLNLGCGNDPLKGAINHDLEIYGPHVDVAWDLNVRPWPWPDNSFDTVLALDVLEHLQSFMDFFNECWRILKPGGKILVRTPMWNSPNAAIDPTHVRCYHPESFDYLDPTTGWGQKYGMYTARKWRKVDLKLDLVNIHIMLSTVKD